MRILFDATPLQTGHRHRGVGTYTRNLLRALIALDSKNEYRLIVHLNGGSSGAESPGLDPVFQSLPANVTLLHLPRPLLGRLTALASHQGHLPGLLAREKGDLFHSPGFVAALSVPGVPRHSAMPMVVTLHDFIPLHVPALFNNKAINRWWYDQQIRMARRATTLICVSEATRQDAISFMDVSPERCIVVPEGVDRTVFHPPAAEEPAQEPPYILFVGGDYRNKNRCAALAAFSRFCQATTLPHHMIMVGKDSRTDRQVQAKHPELDLARIRRKEQVSQESLARLYRQADVLLFPSTCEGFGLPVLEAMASGTPVITSKLSSLPEVAGDAALLVDPYDVDALTTALVRVLGETELANRLRTRGLRRAAAFSWQETARQTLDVYRRALFVHS
ncbi:MAG: glycosyltransferase family 1 protein [Chloroflexota bacterium]|nr:glycosyltransferase family 1 protein [Chloroflexota bacterium]